MHCQTCKEPVGPQAPNPDRDEGLGRPYRMAGGAPLCRTCDPLHARDTQEPDPDQHAEDLERQEAERLDGIDADRDAQQATDEADQEEPGSPCIACGAPHPDHDEGCTCGPVMHPSPNYLVTNPVERYGQEAVDRMTAELKSEIAADSAIPQEAPEAVQGTLL